MFQRNNFIFSVCLAPNDILILRNKLENKFCEWARANPTRVGRKNCLREDDNDYSRRGIPRKLRPRFCDCVLDRPRVPQYSMPGESVANVCEASSRQSGHLYIHVTIEVTAPAIKVARDTHREERVDSESRNERKREMLQRRYRGERGYIIYISLKGLHKNVWSTKKDDGTVTVAAAAPRDSTRLIVVKTTRPIRNTKDRQRSDGES